jgi:hypothetical protein
MCTAKVVGSCSSSFIASYLAMPNAPDRSLSMSSTVTSPDSMVFANIHKSWYSCNAQNNNSQHSTKLGNKI